MPVLETITRNIESRSMQLNVGYATDAAIHTIQSTNKIIILQPRTIGSTVQMLIVSYIIWRWVKLGYYIAVLRCTYQSLSEETNNKRLVRTPFVGSCCISRFL